MMTRPPELPANRHDAQLQLLFSEARAPDSGPIIVLPGPAGSGMDAIARSLAGSIESGRWRLLAAPDSDADVIAQRDWHRDLWLAMPAAECDSVALVTGASAGYLAAVLGDGARTVVFVRDPVSALEATGEALPKLQAMEDLAETPAEDAPARLLRVANPQSRALLAPWHDPSKLTVSPGPPSDADRWREALFGDVLPHLDANALEHAPRVARELAQLLGGRPKPVVQAAKAVLDEVPGALEDSPRTDMLLRLNWLDAELYAHCLRPSGQPA
jgi:hypothetical protein